MSWEPHRILGVPKNARPAEVKDAFRSLAKRYHPDRCKELGAEEKFKRICDAYHTLLPEPEMEALPGRRPTVRQQQHPAAGRRPHGQPGWFDRLARRRSGSLAIVGGVVLLGCCIQYGGYWYYVRNREVLLLEERGAPGMGSRPSNLRGRFLMALMDSRQPADPQLPRSSSGGPPTV